MCLGAWFLCELQRRDAEDEDIAAGTLVPVSVYTDIFDLYNEEWAPIVEDLAAAFQQEHHGDEVTGRRRSSRERDAAWWRENCMTMHAGDIREKAPSCSSVDLSAHETLLLRTVQDTDITFKVNDGGVTSTVMTVDGAESRVGIGTTTPSTKLDVSGTVNATAFTGPITGAVTTSGIQITQNGTVIFEGSTDDGFETTLTVANPTADRTITIPNVTGTVVTTGDTGSITSGMFASSTSLQILSSSGSVLKTIFGAGA